MALYHKSAAASVFSRKTESFASSSCPDPVIATASLEIDMWVASKTWYNVKSPKNWPIFCETVGPLPNKQEMQNELANYTLPRSTNAA